MRKTILGTIAALAAGATSALAQGPGVPPPAPIGPGGGSTLIPTEMPGMPGAGMGMPGPGMGSPGMGGPGMGMGMPGPGMGGPGMGMGAMPGPGMGGPPPGTNDPSAAFPGGGMPGYPQGTHGQQSWTPPNVDGVNSRLAPKAWLEFDYILGFAKSQKANFPYVTTSAPLAGGILGNPSTYVLHSQGDLGLNLVNGARISGGFWRDEARRYGYYMSGFFTEFKTNEFASSSDSTGQPLLARPFFNTATGQQDVLLTSFPTYLAGGISVVSGTQFWGAEGGPIVNLYRSCPDDIALWNVNLLTGFRYLDLHERFEASQNSVLLDGHTAAFDGKLYGAGSMIGVSDRFDTYNRFYAGQVGLNTELRLNRWTLNTTTKVALGVVNQRIDVRGQSTLTGPNSPDLSVIHAGLFANAANSGRTNQDKFAVAPEVNVNLGYQWRSWLTTSIGYNFIYISNVVRPTEQFSNAVNPAIVPLSSTYGVVNNAPTPNLVGTTSDFWFQGVTFSITARY
jgi:hypothetical protein